jgi:pentatricopeptide repeat protein
LDFPILTDPNLLPALAGSDDVLVLDAPMPDTTGGAEEALIAGYALRDAGSVVAAELSFREAVAADPASAEAHGALGSLVADGGRWAEAVPEFRMAADLEPSRIDWCGGLAHALSRSGDTDGALEVWRAMLERRPDSAQVHRALARLYAAAARPLDAIDHFRESLFLDAGDFETAVDLADVLIQFDDPLAAVEQLQPGLRRDPDHPRGQFALARAWLELGERGKAVGALDRCLAADPEDIFRAAALVARIEGDPAETMSRAYVRALFDRYAERFDEDLLIDN